MLREFRIWVMDVIVLLRDRGAWVMCMLISMNSNIRMPMFGSCFTRSEKKGMYGQIPIYK